MIAIAPTIRTPAVAGTRAASAKASSTVHAAGLAFVALAALTLLAAGVSLLAPGAAGGGRPHPTLHPTAGAILSILANNARALIAPFLLAALGFGSGPIGRTFGDLAVGGPLGLLAAQVGLELGRWDGRLLPYIPQLPLEYAAAATAAAVWLTHRTTPRASPRELAAPVALTLCLLAIAAAIEVLATPHAR